MTAAPRRPDFRPDAPAPWRVHAARRATLRQPPSAAPVAGAGDGGTRGLGIPPTRRCAAPDLGRAGVRQDPAGARVRARPARRRADRRRDRRLPDGAAHAPVGARGARAGHRPRARTPTRPGLRPASTASSVTYARIAKAPRRWTRRPARRDAADRRRGPPPRRGPDLGRGVRHRVRRPGALVAAVRHAVPLRRDADPGRAATTATGSPSPTSPTRSRRPSPTTSAGR